MRKEKSFLEKLSDCNEQLFGVKLPVSNIKSYKRVEKEGTVRLFLKNKTNENLPGYSVVHICGITKAVLPDTYTINPKRLDAPCEMCVNRQCPYSWGEIR